MAMKIISKEEQARQMRELVETVSYVNPDGSSVEIERDENGVPIVAPEPNDPDDE